jgi:hypothetical protein
MELYREEKAKPKLFWKLENTDPDNISLVICDAAGETIIGGNILRINKTTGQVERHSCVARATGLELDKSGRVKSS